MYHRMMEEKKGINMKYINKEDEDDE